MTRQELNQKMIKECIRKLKHYFAAIDSTLEDLDYQTEKNQVHNILTMDIINNQEKVRLSLKKFEMINKGKIQCTDCKEWFEPDEVEDIEDKFYEHEYICNECGYIRREDKDEEKYQDSIRFGKR